MKKIVLVFGMVLLVIFTGCTKETQNKIGRSIQNWTGTNGVLDIYMGEKLVQRFIKIDKLSTAVLKHCKLIRFCRDHQAVG